LSSAGFALSYGSFLTSVSSLRENNKLYFLAGESKAVETVHLCHRNTASPVKPSGVSPSKGARTFKPKEIPHLQQFSVSPTLFLVSLALLSLFLLTEPQHLFHIDNSLNKA
jgi:hypothetical protein